MYIMTNEELERGMCDRTERLLGADAMEKIRQKRVIIFGVGGVGSWCAESLVRSGFRLRISTILYIKKNSAHHFSEQNSFYCAYL
ncbi:MAG: ThiF family adenylyltransferase [Marinilabiliaceae bacterium]|nr:ThiF family adenylyltransferase [Marinilabiliaceae bacterium]